MLEYQLDAEFEPEPVFKLGDEEYRGCGIHPQTGKLCLRIDALGCEPQAPGEIGYTPIADLGLARARFHKRLASTGFALELAR